jgi:DNA-binding transcriptional ArsR family regulator
MDRLTKRAEYNCACWNGNQDYTTHKRYLELLDRLAAYEDTGLSPEEVTKLAQEIEALKKSVDQLYADTKFFKMLEKKGKIDIDATIAKVDKWAKAEQEGRLVILQRKPNDAYYHRNYDTGELELNIELHGGDPDGQYPEIDSCASWE